MQALRQGPGATPGAGGADRTPWRGSASVSGIIRVITIILTLIIFWSCMATLRIIHTTSNKSCQRILCASVNVCRPYTHTYCN